MSGATCGECRFFSQKDLPGYRAWGSEYGRCACQIPGGVGIPMWAMKVIDEFGFRIVLVGTDATNCDAFQRKTEGGQ